MVAGTHRYLIPARAPGEEAGREGRPQAGGDDRRLPRSRRPHDAEEAHANGTRGQFPDQRLSSEEDTNMAAAITGLSAADTAHKAALGAAATINKLSLLDYL